MNEAPFARRDADQVEARIAALEQALAQAERRLDRLYLTDPLTELLNRKGLQASLSEQLHRVGARNLLVLLVDIDDFRRINESLGHAAGDVVLREIGHVLRHAAGDRTAIGRIGGDEFMVILPETDDREGQRAAEAFRLAIAETTITLATGPVRVTASLSLSSVSQHTPSIDEVLSEAHLSMGAAKKSGKNRVSLAAAPQEGAPPIARIVAEVKRGRGFRSVMQPIMSLERTTPVAFELLARSTVDVFEMPVDFFRLSQEANILTLVDHRCFKTSLAASAVLPRHIQANVNVFPSTLLAVPAEDLLRAFPSGRALSSYCVEISEAQIIGDPSYLVSRVNGLRQNGVKIAIDDVGFGRTCLENLIMLDPDVVKIDRRCVTGVKYDAPMRRSLERLLRVIGSLEAEVVAEGIETDDDLEVLRDLGVGAGQGYLWGRPTPVPSADDAGHSVHRL
ncbi:MAG: EAL domain-containing protein [Myxococcota bacterium]